MNTASNEAAVSISRNGNSNMIRLQIRIPGETTEIEMTPESFALALTGFTEAPAKYTLRRITGQGRVHPNAIGEARAESATPPKPPTQ